MTNEGLACQILGIDPCASEDEIRSAARRLLLVHHPDVGGTSFGVRCVLAARETLLRRLS